MEEDGQSETVVDRPSVHHHSVLHVQQEEHPQYGQQCLENHEVADVMPRCEVAPDKARRDREDAEDHQRGGSHLTAEVDVDQVGHPVGLEPRQPDDAQRQREAQHPERLAADRLTTSEAALVARDAASAAGGRGRGRRAGAVAVREKAHRLGRRPHQQREGQEDCRRSDAQPHPGIAPPDSGDKKSEYKREDHRSGGRAHLHPHDGLRPSPDEPLEHDAFEDGVAGQGQPQRAEDAVGQVVFKRRVRPLDEHEGKAEEHGADGQRDPRRPRVVSPRAHDGTEHPAGERPHRQRAEDEGAAPTKVVLHGDQEYAGGEDRAADVERALDRRHKDDNPAVKEPRGSFGRG